VVNLAQLTGRWNGLGVQARAAIAVCAFGLIGAIAIAAAIGQTSRTQLFAGALGTDQLAEVEEQLAEWNVVFTPAGDNVLVDRARRNDLLLRLSLAGVPHAHVDGSGDVLAKLSALTPQEVINAQTRQGLAGDIELGLRGIDGVQDARVIVAPAKEGTFADETSRQATASVRLRLAPGAQLSPQAISGIRSFVSASVPGLERRNVTIVDDRGVALQDSAEDGDAGDLQRSLQSALDEALGVGTTIVRVHVESDRRHVTRTSAAIFVDAARVSDLAQVRMLASAALGTEQQRGDRVELQALSFARPLTARKDVWWLLYGAIVPLLPAAAISIAILAALRFCAAPCAELVHAFAERAKLARTAGAMRGADISDVRGALLNEPPHAAAAVISALPAATAAAVLELYPESERAAIVRRMQRPLTPLLAGMEKFVEKSANVPPLR
jgi:flagellar biosynthesis/type III secretory pathway M-ring protein FliF/YscJ